VIAKARGFAESGDLRFAAELLKHAVFASPDHAEAKQALGDVYQRLGFGAENALWRNFYLTGQQELRDGITPPPLADIGAEMASALTVEQLLDTLAIRVDGPRAAAESLVIVWTFTDIGMTLRTALSNGALIQTKDPRTSVKPDLELTLTKTQLLSLLAGHGLDGIEHTGDPATIQRLMGLLDTPDPAFPIVTP
jgi:alkyl sulfatase BDS1-like metallo-beta-lactamase superfamily hydrolase